MKTSNIRETTLQTDVLEREETPCCLKALIGKCYAVAKCTLIAGFLAALLVIPSFETGLGMMYYFSQSKVIVIASVTDMILPTIIGFVALSFIIGVGLLIVDCVKYCCLEGHSIQHNR